MIIRRFLSREIAAREEGIASQDFLRRFGGSPNAFPFSDIGYYIYIALQFIQMPAR
jgi:hypothetical protein